MFPPGQTWVMELCSTILKVLQPPVKTSIPIVNFDSNSLTAHSFYQGLCLTRQLPPCLKSHSPPVECPWTANHLILSPATTAIKLWSKNFNTTHLHLCSLFPHTCSFVQIRNYISQLEIISATVWWNFWALQNNIPNIKNTIVLQPIKSVNFSSFTTKPSPI